MPAEECPQPADRLLLGGFRRSGVGLDSLKQEQSLPNFARTNQAKADFDDIYNQPDPRQYFRALGQYDYTIPQEAKPVFEDTLDAYREIRGNGTTRVLDLGCSYGINAALLKFGLTIDDLYDHYLDPRVCEVTRSELMVRDADLLAGRTENPELEVVGLDSAEHAVEYAKGVGFIDDGLAVNLEETHPPEAVSEKLAGIDVIISTGCVGYVGKRTFERILEAACCGVNQQPWVASFVLRMFSYDQVQETLGEFGLDTEKVDNISFQQRRFVSQEEQDQVISRLEELGVDPTEKEADGHYYADFFFSRPRGEAEAVGLDEILRGAMVAS